MKRQLNEITGDLRTFFNWSANALLPLYPGAADKLLDLHKPTIQRIAAQLLTGIYTPATIYRGIILREPAKQIDPQPSMQYLSFSTERRIAEHFADVNGFGSDILDVAQQLGTHGYLIEYTPQPEEILFHFALLDILPYAEAFYKIGLNGNKEINGLRQQREVMILQPKTPLTNIVKYQPQPGNATTFINYQILKTQ